MSALPRAAATALLASLALLGTTATAAAAPAAPAAAHQQPADPAPNPAAGLGALNGILTGLTDAVTRLTDALKVPLLGQSAKSTDTSTPADTRRPTGEDALDVDLLDGNVLDTTPENLGLEADAFGQTER
ncbi:hypothetical protein [Streptomyces sp. NPDC017941]|uniref:hypothetical protein n=1 Tax=Streptomyces sp. NPDC017941 TaxID=3365018 RepID=UPI0037BA7035